MKRFLVLLTCFCVLATFARFASAHCEVPCGIYADQLRFDQMLEDHVTIAKAIASVREIAETMSDGASATAVNQSVRWVTTKESHATHTQHVIAQYFMTQRIKPGTEGYAKKLTAAHAVMVAAMKCKQGTDPKSADSLREAILDFYRAYEGKEPKLDDE